jgi:outer membrane protein assembly factor BamB
VTAINTGTGQVVWRNQHPGKTAEEISLGGLLTTAGGVAFTSNGQDLIALATRDGTELWRFHAGARISSAPITYETDGVQHVAVTAGNALIAFAMAPATPAAGQGGGGAKTQR